MKILTPSRSFSRSASARLGARRRYGRMPPRTEHVVLAGGCFWGMQLVFEALKASTASSPAMPAATPTTAQYETVSTGTTGHAESVEITYDPSKISFKTLLDVYFQVAHDPTELNRQGPDEGTQYRSEIFYTHRRSAPRRIATIAHLQQTHVFTSPIVTIVAPLADSTPPKPTIRFRDAQSGRSVHRLQRSAEAQGLRQEFPELVKANPPFQAYRRRVGDVLRVRSADRSTNPVATFGNVMSLKS